jgi:hypothetical protein
VLAGVNKYDAGKILARAESASERRHLQFIRARANDTG